MSWTKESRPNSKNVWGIPLKLPGRGGVEVEAFIIHEETVAAEDLNIDPEDLCLIPEDVQSGATKWTRNTINLSSQWNEVPFYSQFDKWLASSSIESAFYPRPGLWASDVFYPQFQDWEDSEFYPVYIKWHGDIFYLQAFRWGPVGDEDSPFYPMYGAWVESFYAVSAVGWNESEFYISSQKWRIDSFYC